MRNLILTCSLLNFVACWSGLLAASATIEESVAGPAGAELKYVVSPQGSHVAAVGRKGSRTVVTIDGVEGPRFDEIAVPARPWVDPRPLHLGRPRGYFIDGVPALPVVFSNDGRRHVYVGRRGQEWVLVVDGKETLTLPVENNGGQTVALAHSMEFTGTDGKHLILTCHVPGGNDMWVDGQKWPGMYATGGGGGPGTVDPLVSPDGAHIAAVAQITGKRVVLDGKDTGYTAAHLAFTPDSRTLISVADLGGSHALLVDGKPTARALGFPKVVVAPVGNRIIAVASETEAGAVSFVLMVDGKALEESRGKAMIETVTFSPDGKHWAAICGPAGARFVIRDGKKGQEYQGVENNLTFTADSSKLVYIGTMNSSPTTHFLVVNENESDAFYAVPRFWFSADGKRIAVAGQADAAGKRHFAIDGKPVALPPRAIPNQVVFSPDGQHHVVIAGSDASSGLIFFDGKETGLNGNVMFSPDSKHLAVVGVRVSDNKRGLFVDGELVRENARDDGIRFRSFTPDSQHLLWIALESSSTPNVAAGSLEWVTYVDGEAIARCERSSIADQLFAASPPVPTGDHRAWAMGVDGSVTVLSHAGEGVKRHRIKPGAGTSVATMLAEARLAPARAAANVEEEKKKADEIAVAKKARATADAAESARKAKAAADELAAKRKKDYDEAVAKQKADREAALVKQAELLKQKQQKK